MPVTLPGIDYGAGRGAELNRYTGKKKSSGDILQDFMNDAYGNVATQLSPEVLERLFTANAKFNDRELQQKWDIAALQERGANQRAGMSASASRAASANSARAAIQAASIAAKTQRYGIDVQRLTDQEKIALDRELGRAGIGVNLLQTAAQLSGPENYLDYVNLLRGGRDLGGAQYFLGGLTGQNQLAGFQAPGGSPTPLTMDSLLKGLGAAGNGGVTSDGSNMTAQDQQAKAFQENVASLLGAGAHKFAPGSLERLSPSELGLLRNAAGKSGYNWNDVVKNYSNAQVRQGSAMAA